MRFGILQVFLILFVGFLLFGNIPKKFSELSSGMELLKKKWEERNIPKL